MNRFIEYKKEQKWQSLSINLTQEESDYLNKWCKKLDIKPSILVMQALSEFFNTHKKDTSDFSNDGMTQNRFMVKHELKYGYLRLAIDKLNLRETLKKQGLDRFGGVKGKGVLFITNDQYQKILEAYKEVENERKMDL